MVTVQPLASQLQIAGVIKTPFATGILHLGQAAVALGPTTAVSDFTEATFSGYAPVTNTIAYNPYIDVNGGITFYLPSTQFNFVAPASPAVPVTNTIYNWWYTDSAGNLLCAGQWANPIPMYVNGNSIPFSLWINFQGFQPNADTGDYQ